MEEVVQDLPAVLFIDIETAPALSYLWSLFAKGPINHQMQQERTYVLGWCAKWLGDDRMQEGSIEGQVMTRDATPTKMLTEIWHLLDQADYVVAHNGDRFDIKRLNTEFLLAGLKPPSPYKQIDTLKMVKRCFGFDSNRLDYLSYVLYGERKEKHDGFDTWLGCMRDDPKAWDDMMKYNRKDVLLLERIYLDIRAWDKSHPNVLLGNTPQASVACTTCGSPDVYRTNKTTQTNVSKFVVWECGECGASMRERKATERSELVRAK